MWMDNVVKYSFVSLFSSVGGELFKFCINTRPDPSPRIEVIPFLLLLLSDLKKWNKLSIQYPRFVSRQVPIFVCLSPSKKTRRANLKVLSLNCCILTISIVIIHGCHTTAVTSLSTVPLQKENSIFLFGCDEDDILVGSKAGSKFE